MEKQVLTITAERHHELLMTEIRYQQLVKQHDAVVNSTGNTITELKQELTYLYKYKDKQT